MEIILDTSFILTCIKEKLDFLQAEDYGELVLSEQVLEELEKLSKTEKKEKDLALLALEIIKKNKNKFKIVRLEGKYVDSGIKKYIKGRESRVIVATLDREMKKVVRGKAGILTIRGRKKFALE